MTKDNTMDTTMDAKMDDKEKKRWYIALGLSAIATFAMFLAGFGSQILFFTLFTVLALTIWALELLPDALVAIMLPILYIVTEVGKPAVILSSWSSSVGWLVLGGLVIGAFMMKTGLAKRAGLYSINLVGGSFIRLLWGILFAGVILAPFIPSVLGRSAVIAVICLGICETLHLQPRSKEGFCVLFAGFIAVSAPKLAFITGGADIAVGMRIASETIGRNISWFEFFLHNFIPAMLYSVMSMLCLIFVMRPQFEGNAKESIQQQIADLGAIKEKEKKAFVLLAILLLFMVTDKLHGINIGWVMLLLPCVAFLPGFKLLGQEDLKKLNYLSVLFVIGCMTIGSAAVSAGLDKIISKAIIPLIQGSELYSVIALIVIGALLNFVLTPLSAYAALTASVVEIANFLNIEPLLFVYAYNYGLDQYLFPYEFGILLFFYATGYLDMKNIILILLLRMLLTIPFVAFIAYPYWKMFL